jgi:hypothetical protein
MKDTEEKNRIRIRNPVIGIRGSVSKYYGSGTLFSRTLIVLLFRLVWTGSMM